MAELLGEALATVLNWFAPINLVPIANAFDTLGIYIQTACYFLPMQSIAMIFAAMLLIFDFALIIRILKTIWSILPIL